jgi:hypothetical protein
MAMPFHAFFASLADMPLIPLLMATPADAVFASALFMVVLLLALASALLVEAPVLASALLLALADEPVLAMTGIDALEAKKSTSKVAERGSMLQAVPRFRSA